MSDENDESRDPARNKKMVQLQDIAMAGDPDEVDLEKLKEAIRSGTYTPDIEELADRMLWDAHCVDGLLSR